MLKEVEAKCIFHRPMIKLARDNNSQLPNGLIRCGGTFRKLALINEGSLSCHIESAQLVQLVCLVTFFFHIACPRQFFLGSLQ